MMIRGNGVSRDPPRFTTHSGEAYPAPDVVVARGRY